MVMSAECEEGRRAMRILYDAKRCFNLVYLLDIREG